MFHVSHLLLSVHYQNDIGTKYVKVCIATLIRNYTVTQENNMSIIMVWCLACKSENHTHTSTELTVSLADNTGQKGIKRFLHESQAKTVATETEILRHLFTKCTCHTKYVHNNSPHRV